MANYYATCRSNYFKVKNKEKFLAAFESVPSINIVEKNDTFAILGDDPDGAGWPSFTYDDDVGGNEEEIDVVAMVSEHLIDGEVAIFMEVGAEKSRYVVGYAECINSKGQRKGVSLMDIYDMAKELTDRPEDILPAEY